MPEGSLALQPAATPWALQEAQDIRLVICGQTTDSQPCQPSGHPGGEARCAPPPSSSTFPQRGSQNSSWLLLGSTPAHACPLCVHSVTTLMSALRPQLCARIPGKHNPKVWAHKEKHDPTFKKSKLHMEQCCISSSQNQSKAGTSAPGNRGDGFSFSVCVSPKNNGNNE